MANVVKAWDVGFGKSAIWGIEGGSVVVSHVAEAKAQRIDLKAIGLDAKSSAQLITNGIGQFWVGLGASEKGRAEVRTDFERIAGSHEVRALLYATLGKSATLCESIGQSALTWKDHVHLVVGVPLGFATGEDSKQRRDSLRSWLLRSGEQVKAHEWKDGKKDRVANITQVSIFAQPHAAYLDYVLNDDGTENDNAVTGEVGVISLGNNTVELFMLRDGEPVERFMHAEKSGVRWMLETINNEHGGGYEIAELDVMLRSGKLDYKKAADTWQGNLAGVIERGWSSSHKRFTKVIAVGGGVRFALPKLKDLFGTRLVQGDDPIQSIARGLYKWGVTQ